MPINSTENHKNDWANHAQLFIIIVILINTATLGIETLSNLSETQILILEMIDKICLFIFTIEIIIRMIYAFRHKKNFFANAWNIFDLIIVFVSISAESAFFTIFRTFRILRLGKAARLLKSVRAVRLSKLISSLEELRKIVQAIVLSIPGILWTLILLSLVLYIYAILGINLYGAELPEMFGDLPTTFFTLFQVMTFESWATALARPLFETHPFSWIYFISFILITTYIALNVIVGVIVSSVEEVNAKKNQNNDEKVSPEIKAQKDQNRELKQELSKLKEQIESIENLIK